MIVAGFVTAGLAALVHIFIFYLESIAWESARTRAIFRTGSAEDARATKLLAFNQGFYNLFLALLALGGIALAASGHLHTGTTLALAGTGTMLAAAIVLFTASRSHRSAAIKQGALPLLAVLALTIGLIA